MISERKRIAFEFVSDASKQVTTVAAALVGLSITFRQDLIKGARDVPLLLQGTVVMYVLTVFAGVLVLLALAGALGHEPVAVDPHAPIQEGARDPNADAITDEELTIYRPSIRLPFSIQLVMFFVAVLLTFLFGWTRLGVPLKAAQTPSFAFARAELLGGVRCVIVHRSDLEAAKCARRATDVAFRYRPPPSDAAPYITAIMVTAASVDSAAATSAKTAKTGKGSADAKSAKGKLSPLRPRLIDAYMSLDSVMSLARFDSASATP
jgi:hypothetical protein